MRERAFVVGVGMTRFEKIESRDWEYPDMVSEAVGNALDDAGIGYDAIQRAAVGYVFAPSAAGQRGQWVVNPSGGLISKGHPLGATGLAQCADLNWQLRGQAGPRQVPGATVGLQHNLGLGGACVVTLYRSGALHAEA